ncbi:hypothetical protein [Rhizobium leguminosarum]|uniref:hypothetical protein n=1 Tax=Rhizobium leguminosarum TaxID=384 RepID=UPI0003094DC0|nr:hypothetical protein [Rhizobium leguminosarum]MBY5371814.1 hypothetical protein [Rhizobium leguminosarum]
MNAKKQEENPSNDGHDEQAIRVCGVIMPIADMEKYPAGHWLRVRKVIDEAIEAAGMVPRMVSDSEEVTVIQSSIVQNIYENEIVVCDVSGKNPNVMFELGMRLAFDKPTVVIKDDATSYSFDTSPIQHIGYRHDLRFDDVRDLQTKITQAIVSSVKAKEANADYSPFIRHFGKFTVAKIETKEVTNTEFVTKQLTSIQAELSRLNSRVSVWSGDLPGVSPSRQGVIDALLSNHQNLIGQLTVDEAIASVAKHIVAHSPSQAPISDGNISKMIENVMRVAAFKLDRATARDALIDAYKAARSERAMDGGPHSGNSDITTPEQQ